MPEDLPDDDLEEREDDASGTDADENAIDWEPDDNPNKKRFAAQRKVNRDLERKQGRQPARNDQQVDDSDEPTEAEIRAIEAEVQLTAREVADEFGDAGRALLD